MENVRNQTAHKVRFAACSCCFLLLFADDCATALVVVAVVAVADVSFVASFELEQE